MADVAQGLGARSRRDLLRKTWVPTGKGLKQLEDEKSVVIRFVVGYRCSSLSQSARGPKDVIPGSLAPAGTFERGERPTPAIQLGLLDVPLRS